MLTCRKQSDCFGHMFLHGKNKASQKEIHYLLNEAKYSAKIYRLIFSNVMVAHAEHM